MFIFLRPLSTNLFKLLIGRINNQTLSFPKRLLINNEIIFIKDRKMTGVVSESTASSGTKKKYLIVGLGNLDLNKNSRHSVGMQFVDQLERLLQGDKTTKWRRDKSCMGYTQTVVLDNGTKLILLKPKPAMNLNGRSVSKTVKVYGIDIQNVYLAHDDIDLALGKSSIKEGGSARGHNGVRSVIDSLRSDIMTRVRIGIGYPDSQKEVADYVLANFDQKEQQIINGVITDSFLKMAKHMNCEELIRKFSEAEKENSPHRNHFS